MKNPIKFFFSKEAEEGYIPNRELFAHAAGLAGQNAAYGFISGWLFYFCNVILKIGAEKVGIITGIARAWDAVNDPVVGAYIDRRKSAPGNKLRPYLLYFPIPIAVLSALMFVNFGFSELGAIVYFLIIYLLWDTLYSFQDVGLWGMLSMTSPHSSEHLRMAQWARIGAGFGGAPIAIFPLILGAKESLGLTESQLFLLGGIVFGFGGQILSMVAAGAKERVAGKEPEDSIWEGMMVVRHNKVLLTISLARVLGSLSPVIPAIYFFKYGVSTINFGRFELNGESLMFWYGIFSGIPYAFTQFMAKEITIKLGGAKRTVLIAKTSVALSRIIAFFIGFTSPGRIAFSAFFQSLASIPDGASEIAQTSLWCDSVDYVEWKTGKRTEGISYAFQNFLSKLTGSISLLINGFILGRLGFDAALGVSGQPSVFYKWQWPIFMLGPVVGIVLHLLTIATIDYPAEMKEKVERELLERRALQEELEREVGQVGQENI
ncbi:MAG: hypothetical protein GX345_06335 [Clostridiales bacterium]|nr:hypothetical protein [Clostridiales bacterium]